MSQTPIKLGFHGDVVLTKINTVPAGYTEKAHDGNIILAYGEKTGHKHTVLCEGKNVTLYENKEGQLVIKVEEPVSLTHEEHVALKDPITHSDKSLDPGVYNIGFQQQYDYSTQQATRVAD